MARLSRPYQVALVALLVLAAVWLVALRGHSSSNSGASSAVPTPQGSAQSAKGAAPSAVYHGPAPGVEGLTRDIAKARETVAASQKGESSGTHKGSASTHTGAPVLKAHGSPVAASPDIDTTRAGGRSKAAEARTGPLRKPPRQLLVERALREGKIAVVLFWNPKGADDAAVQTELRVLEAVHHLIRPVAGVPAVRRALKGSGLELQKRFAAFEARANQVTSFGSITSHVHVYGTPTILVINKRGVVTVLTGLTDAYAIEQAIDDARHA